MGKDLGFDLLEGGRIDDAVVRVLWKGELAVGNETKGIAGACWVYITIYRSFGAIGIDGEEIRLWKLSMEGGHHGLIFYSSALCERIQVREQL